MFGWLCKAALVPNAFPFERVVIAAGILVAAIVVVVVVQVVDVPIPMVAFMPWSVVRLVWRDSILHD